MLFIYLFLTCWIFIAVDRLFLLLQRAGASRFTARASHCGGFFCWEAQALGHTGFGS